MGTTAVDLGVVSAGRSVVFQNNGAAALYLGCGSNVAATNGIVLAAGSPGGSVSVGGAATETTWWAVAASGTVEVVILVSD